VWHWIEEGGERSLQVRPLLKGKIWTLDENDDDDNDYSPYFVLPLWPYRGHDPQPSYYESWC